VTTDLADDTTDIHPKNKKDVGIRLAKLALANTYSIPVSGALSPMYNYMRVDGDMVTLFIKNAGTGLRIDGRAAEGFFVAGPDKQFYPGEARVAGSTITVISKQVKQPVAVRYAFSNTAVGNISSREGMPLSPFRTDDWEVDTSSVK
jgi:sialate O-acetylesterase